MNTEAEERIEAVNRYIRGDKPSNICRDAGSCDRWRKGELRAHKTRYTSLYNKLFGGQHQQ